MPTCPRSPVWQQGSTGPTADSAASRKRRPLPISSPRTISVSRKPSGRPAERSQSATYNPGLADFTDAATALGIVIALSVLAMSVGLIRSETAPDLRTLTATGASGMTRRTITAATTAALGLLGAILGTAGAVIAGMAWRHSGLTATAGGWLFAGREPPAVARQSLD
jgi:hypothetical protein